MKLTKNQIKGLEEKLREAVLSLDYGTHSLCDFGFIEDSANGYVQFVKNCKWSLDKFATICSNGTLTISQVYKVIEANGPIGMAYAAKLLVYIEEEEDEIYLNQANTLYPNEPFLGFSYPKWEDVAFATLGYTYRKATHSSNNKEEKIMHSIDNALKCVEKYDDNFDAQYYNLSSYIWKNDAEYFIKKLSIAIEDTNDNNLEYYGTKVLIQLLQSLVNYQAMQQG